MSLFPLSEKSQAYVDGYKAGRIDRQLGIRSDYAFHSFESEPDYVRWYSWGYRNGILGLKF